jgi:hypothetical protein
MWRFVYITDLWKETIFKWQKWWISNCGFFVRCIYCIGSDNIKCCEEISSCYANLCIKQEVSKVYVQLRLYNFEKRHGINKTLCVYVAGEAILIHYAEFTNLQKGIFQCQIYISFGICIWTNTHYSTNKPSKCSGDHHNLRNDLYQVFQLHQQTIGW